MCSHWNVPNDAIENTEILGSYQLYFPRWFFLSSITWVTVYINITRRHLYGSVYSFYLQQNEIVFLTAAPRHPFPEDNSARPTFTWIPSC